MVILKLLWKNFVVEATKNFKSDYKSSKRIKITSKYLSRIKPGPVKIVNDEIEKIRQAGMRNFNLHDDKYRYENWSSKMYELLHPKDKN